MAVYPLKKIIKSVTAAELVVSKELISKIISK